MQRGGWALVCTVGMPDIPNFAGMKLGRRLIQIVEFTLFVNHITLYTLDPRPSALTHPQTFRKWSIGVNPEKIAAMYFSKGISETSHPLKIFDRAIPWVIEVKYFEITLDPYIYFDKHVKRVRDRAVFCFDQITNIQSELSLRNKVTLFTTCIRPVLIYAGVVFAHISRYKVRKL
ncbi:hypothetical protein EVAR_89341_1 [Eumeta japonica]|uniref:Uncharacterized protein n=1 Tax=Eumeta variegata TaxID=151549 RepID=A0A4C1Y5L7_EUMVA|nr:hypothetical protein EVAR_89341_1 [Eumeta japonica]